MSVRSGLYNPEDPQERTLRAEEVAKHAYRLLGELPNLRLLTVHLKAGVCGIVVGSQRLTGAGPLPSERAFELALELRLILLRAARDGSTTGQIVVNVDEGTMDANLTTGPDHGWHVPDLRERPEQKPAS